MKSLAVKLLDTPAVANLLLAWTGHLPDSVGPFPGTMVEGGNEGLLAGAGEIAVAGKGAGAAGNGGGSDAGGGKLGVIAALRKEFSGGWSESIELDLLQAEQHFCTKSRRLYHDSQLDLQCGRILCQGPGLQR